MKLSQKLLLITTATTLSSGNAWSTPTSLTKHFSSTRSSDEDVDAARRKLVRNSVVAAATLLVSTPAANAACIQGDLNPKCIGQSKTPYEKALFPQLRGVKPIAKSPTGLNTAIEILREQRTIADVDIRKDIENNELEKAGIKLLGLIPYVTKCCYCVVNDLDEMSGFTEKQASPEKEKELEKEGSTDKAIPLRSIEIAKKEAMELNTVWADVDVAIARGIRGELGDQQTTQETILASLKAALRSHDDFLGSAEAYSRM